MSKDWPGSFDDLIRIRNVSYGGHLLVLGERFLLHQQKTFPSQWTSSVRAVRDTRVAHCSAPGVNTTRCVAYRPLIAILPFLLALSVYTKYTLYLSHLLISLALSTISWIYKIAWILAAR